MCSHLTVFDYSIYFKVSEKMVEKAKKLQTYEVSRVIAGGGVLKELNVWMDKLFK